MATALAAKSPTQRKRAFTEGTRLEQVAVVVLVDEWTASGAELLAGALRQRGRALLVGSRTLGVGQVRLVYEFPGRGGEPSTALLLTIASMRPPWPRIPRRRACARCRGGYRPAGVGGPGVRSGEVSEPLPASLAGSDAVLAFAAAVVLRPWWRSARAAARVCESGCRRSRSRPGRNSRVGRPAEGPAFVLRVPRAFENSPEQRIPRLTAIPSRFRRSLCNRDTLALC